MSRLRLLGLVLATGTVLVLLGSLLAGVGGGVPSGSVQGSRAGATPEVGSPERIRVEVLNAAGVTGVARAATGRIRGAGFDVVYYGNAASFGRDSSVVLDRMGDLDAAERVARAAGIAPVRTSLDSTLYVDVSVVIGRDWEGIPAPVDTAGG